MNLQESLPNEQLETRDNELSIYKSGKVSAEAFAHGSKKIKDAFPKLPASWFTVLDQMLDEEKFSEERFRDAVNSLIKNCVYPEPTIANIISYDRSVKVYTYRELMEKYKDSYYMGSKQDPIFTEYERIDFYGQERFARKEEVERYSLKKWIINNNSQK